MLEKYINHIKKIFKQLNEKDLQLKLKKYKFYKKNIDFFEFIVKWKEIKINSIKLQAVKKWKQLINIKKFSSF